jgi:CheY-like chemotaxis protein
MTEASVVIVDDQPSEAEAFANLVSSTTRLRTKWTTDPSEAIQLCKETFVSVLVLDERMPTMRGTDLYAEVRRVSPYTAAIMLTQEDNAEDAGRAIQLQYKERLHKSRVDELPLVVLRTHAAALGDAAAGGPRAERLDSGRKFMARSPEVWLIHSDLVDSHFIEEDDWRHLVEIHAGQHHKETRNWRSVARTEYEIESRRSVGSELGVKEKSVAEVAGKLSVALEDRSKVSLTSEVTQLQIVEDSFTLPPEPADPTQLHIVTRRIEFAPVYARFRVVLKSICPRCKVERFAVSMVKRQRDMIAIRHTNIMSSGPSQEIITGYRRLG